MHKALIKGYAYPPGSSSRKPAELFISDDTYELEIDQEVVRSGSVHDLKFSDRIGSTNRKIFFTSGTQFESSENDAIDELLANTRHKNSSSTAISKLESSWTIAIASILFTGAIVFGFFKFGLPAAAGYAAQKVPVSATEKLADGAMDLLDTIIFEESKTTETQQAEITERFKSYLSAITDTGGFNYHLHFRSMNGMANAFALPSGDIVVTDTLIDLTTDKELDSILFHEIGHVVERHSLEGIIKGSTMAVVVTIALGDLSTVAELTTGAATFFVQSAYTRAAEAEADDYSLHQMELLDIDPIHFANAMRKISTQGGRTLKNDDDETPDAQYLSSHPSSESRIKKAIARSEVFNKR